MAVEILMPELGESVHEGTVGRWLKQVGDFVKEDEPVVEIMTDKVNTELPSPASGILTKILIPEGEPVHVFAAMGVIEDSAPATVGNGVAAPAPEAKAVDGAKEPVSSSTDPVPTASVPDVAPAPTPIEGRRWYTPVVRAIAKEKQVSEAELASIPGSGQGGRVTKRDLEGYLAHRTPGAPIAAVAKAAPLEAKPAAPTVAGPDQEIVPLLGLRKMIAEAMIRSSQVPTVSTVTQVDVTAMVKFRERNKESFLEQYGVKLTYTPFFIKALTDSLLEHKLLNSSLMPDNKILKNNGVHMGVAVSLGKTGEDGLIVPVIRDCHKKTLIDIARDLEEIARKARANTLNVADVQGGTFTLTNPGSYGALFGTPMINAPQAGILGTYGIQKLPVIIDDMIAIRSIMHLVLTYDHRIVDGLVAGKFLASVRDRLQAFDFFK